MHYMGVGKLGGESYVPISKLFDRVVRIGLFMPLLCIFLFSFCFFKHKHICKLFYTHFFNLVSINEGYVLPRLQRLPVLWSCEHGSSLGQLTDMQ